MSQPERPFIPLGHSISSHHVHGWCAKCPGHSVYEELAAWQVWAATLPEIDAAIRAYWDEKPEVDNEG